MNRIKVDLVCLIVSEKMLNPALSIAFVCLESHMRTVYRFRKHVKVYFMNDKNNVCTSTNLDFCYVCVGEEIVLLLL